MNRRDFFTKGGCGLLASMMAYFGLTSCKKKEEAPAEPPAQAPAQAAEEAGMNREDMVKTMLVEQQGLTEEEAAAKIAEFKDKLTMVEQQCICRNCPSYVAEETVVGFCHPLVGKSGVITEERGCICGSCPVHQQMGLTKGYYCTRGSEMEQI